MKLHENKELAENLRKARGLATELRNVLEEAYNLTRAMGDDWESFGTEVNERSEDVALVEDWLDTLEINEDGTAAAEGF